MKSYWQNLSKREQWLLIISAALLVLFLFYYLLYLPLVAHHDKLSQQLQQQQADLRWMQSASRNILAADAAKVIKDKDKLSLTSRTTQVMHKYKIKGMEISTLGKSSLKVDFAQVVFVDLQRAFYELENAWHIIVERGQIKRLDPELPGLVSCTVTLKVQNDKK